MFGSRIDWMWGPPQFYRSRKISSATQFRTTLKTSERWNFGRDRWTQLKNWAFPVNYFWWKINANKIVTHTFSNRLLRYWFILVRGTTGLLQAWSWNRFCSTFLMSNNCGDSQSLVREHLLMGFYSCHYISNTSKCRLFKWNKKICWFKKEEPKNALKFV